MHRILHIEDDPTNRLLVRKLLAPHGFDVIDAVDGLDGIRKALAERPDLILVDINVPHLDGYEVTLRLRGEASLAGVPIVAITAEGDRSTSLGVGCDGFLQKPIDARTFARTVASFMKGAKENLPPATAEEHLRLQSQRIVARLEANVAELSTANARLREADRARTAFYRNVSHELATPLTPLVGYLKLLIDEELGSVSPPQKKALVSMDGCVQRLRSLVDNLLDVTGLELGKMQFVSRAFDLGRALQLALSQTKLAFAARGHHVLLDVPAHPLPIQGDDGRLVRALVQLLENANKFTPAGGHVGVRVQVTPTAYELTVADSGAGVPLGACKDVFEPFFQADGSPTRNHGGVGIGLAIVRRVADAFQGSVRLEPPGTAVSFPPHSLHGAVFVLALPRPATGKLPWTYAPGSNTTGRMIYLDHNATTPPHDDVLAAMADAARVGWANPSSVHQAGRRARKFVDDARESVAALAGLHPRDVVFTSGGTEANNLALLRPFSEAADGLLITSRLEHPSVLAYAETLAARGVKVVWLPVARDGRIAAADVSAALRDHDTTRPSLVAMHAVHHETGVIQPVTEVLAAVEQHGSQLHVDAVQAAGRVVAAAWHGAHSVALAAHKLRGPKGIGALITRPGILPQPILRGGSQERGLRPGTLDPVAAAGFGVAAQRAQAGGPERYQHLTVLRDRIERDLVDLGASVGVVIRPTVTTPERAPHVVHVLVDGWRGDELAAALDLEGVCVSSGSACSAGTAEPSPAIAAIVGPEHAATALRISMGETSTPADATALLDAFQRVLARASR